MPTNHVFGPQFTWQPLAEPEDDPAAPEMDDAERRDYFQGVRQEASAMRRARLAQGK